jgi:hypothetical protein
MTSQSKTKAVERYYMAMLSEPPASQHLSSKVTSELEHELKDSGLMGTFVEVGSPRFIKFLLQPKLIMRSGWLLDPQIEVSQPEVRAYVLRSPHDVDKTGVLQQLVIYRNQRRAELITQGNFFRQSIQVDLQTFDVLSNSVTPR